MGPDLARFGVRFGGLFLRARYDPCPTGGVHPRQDFIGEPGGGVSHPPSHTTRAEGTSLARERDDAILAAVLAPYSQEPVSENSAFKVCAQLLLDMNG